MIGMYRVGCIRQPIKLLLHLLEDFCCGAVLWFAMIDLVQHCIENLTKKRENSTQQQQQQKAQGSPTHRNVNYHRNCLFCFLTFIFAALSDEVSPQESENHILVFNKS